MASNKQTLKLTKEAVLDLNEASTTNLLTLKWIKAHVGHIGNERDDEATKIGALDVSLEQGISQHSWKEVVKNNLRAGFLKSWQEDG